MAFKDAPLELQAAIKSFWPQIEWENAADVASQESSWNAFADNDTTDSTHPCGSFLASTGGYSVYAEHSVGYFQINVCNFPDWDWKRLWNAYENAGTAHQLWDQAGQKWTPWLETATKLGIL